MKNLLIGIDGTIQALWIIFKGFWIDLTADLLDFKTLIGVAVAIILGLTYLIFRDRPPKI